jgi:hypothetical protein
MAKAVKVQRALARKKPANRYVEAKRKDFEKSRWKIVKS